MARKTRRILLESDYHCGHLVGLTPPSVGTAHGDNEAHRVRRKIFDWRFAALKKIGRVDLHVINGDLIDGDGARSRGTELISTDRSIQADMAAECVRCCKSDLRIITAGTAYHAGDGEDWERIIANNVGARFGGHETAVVNGTTLDIKHHVGSSSVPHARHTAIARDRLWNLLWSDIDAGTPRADVIVRSHTHYHTFAGDSSWLGIITPALMGPGSKYGVRRCSGTINCGFVVFDVAPSGSYNWRVEELKWLDKSRRENITLL